MVRAEVPDYDRVQDELARATEGIDARRVLELGTGSGVTSRRVLERHPHAQLTGVDSSEHMLAAADLPGADLRLQDLRDPLPEGPFDLVFSALAIHHLDGPSKADLFARVAAVLAPGGRFAMADVVVPEDPADVVTPLDDGFDLPDTVPDLLRLAGRRRPARPRELAGARPGGPGGRRGRQLNVRGPGSNGLSARRSFPVHGGAGGSPPRRRSPPMSANFASGRLLFLSGMWSPFRGLVGSGDPLCPPPAIPDRDPRA